LRLAILGAGGHGRVVASVAASKDDWDEIVFYDSAYPSFKRSGNWPVVGDVEDLLDHVAEYQGVIVAIGDNKRRSEFLEILQAVSANVVNIVHPSSVVADDVILGVGITIMPNAVVNIGSKVSSGAIINTSAVVEHDCTVGYVAHLSPGVVLSGGCSLGDFSWMGSGAVCINSVAIGDSVVIGAGSVVTRNLESGKKYVGVPARLVE
jgi:sugar O-acyltransferase (sialic acid O-acetyltransferase NeuD family)